MKSNKNNNNKAKPTLKYIAERLGISKATVSNAFNNPKQLSAALREKIFTECQAQGYTGPSITARSLRTGKTGVIGVLLADSLAYNFTDPVASHFLEGVASTLDQQHINMLLLPSRSDNYQSTQVDTIPDSFIVYGKPKDADVLQRISQQGKPMVTVDFDTELGNSVSVNVDNHGAAYESAKHALSGLNDKVIIVGFRLLNGCDQLRSVDCEKLEGYTESISRRRFEGYQDAIQEWGGQFNSSDVWQFPHPKSQATQMTLRGLLAHPQKNHATVCLCMSDKLAIATLEAAQSLGIKVPEQLRIVGFDNIPEADTFNLTSIHQPLTEKGKIAAEIALGLREFSSIELPAPLVIRGSTDSTLPAPNIEFTKTKV
ncbi:MAG: LacI family DNA-binding transcriptional regulator [Psychromonas sp.]